MIQEKNNVYVAFTRARRFLFVSYPRERRMPWGDISQRRPSRFLDKLLDEEVVVNANDNTSLGL